jgi:hypothetical protein
MAIGYSSFVTPTGNLTPTFGGNRYAASFTNTAVFTCGPGETCAAGVYRQWVKGSFVINGSRVTHVLCGSVVLSAAEYREDGCPPSGSSCAGCTAYGYRTCDWGYTNPDRFTGSNYTMNDAPGFNNVRARDNYTVDLSFVGKLINTSNNTDLVSRTWTVIGSGSSLAASLTTPGMNVASLEVGLTDNDRLFSVDMTENLDTGAPELHVVIQRPFDSAPLSPEALTIALPDAEGHAGDFPLGVPKVYEVGGRSGVTTSLVYALPEDAPVPTLATVTPVLADEQRSAENWTRQLLVTHR